MPRGGGPPPLGAGSLGGPTPPPLPPDARGAEPRFSEASRGGDAGRFADGNRNGYGQTGLGSLAIVYQGERYVVNKDRFVIGRGKQSSDLTLKDPNVSRQHAMVEYQNGVYFIVDMGSTNGVEYNGQRIARKQVAEGDVFRICDHDLFFTYR
jgi:pSer/pThr/pTyr-binding forkhead associated (FHA) protein